MSEFVHEYESYIKLEGRELEIVRNYNPDGPMRTDEDAAKPLMLGQAPTDKDREPSMIENLNFQVTMTCYQSAFNEFPKGIVHHVHCYRESPTIVRRQVAVGSYPCIYNMSEDASIEVSFALSANRAQVHSKVLNPWDAVIFKVTRRMDMAIKPKMTSEMGSKIIIGEAIRRTEYATQQ